MMCGGLFCDDRDRFISEFADSEYQLSREQHRRLRGESRQLRETILRERGAA